MTYTPNIFGRRLQTVRELMGYTREEVEAGLSLKGIHLCARRLAYIEQGVTACTAIEFYGLSKLYGVTFEELCGDFDVRRYQRSAS